MSTPTPEERRAVKAAIRDQLRAGREKLTAAERQEKSGQIADHLATLIRPGDTVLCFAAKEMEVQTDPFLEQMLAQGNPLVVPIIQTKDVSLRLSYIREISVLVPSTFGVPEPVGSEIPADPEDIDTIILPMLGFDRTGGRIGYGAGYYDRFLEKHPGLRKIGIAYGCQEAEKIPVEENDIFMDLIITEDGVVFTKDQ